MTHQRARSDQFIQSITCKCALSYLNWKLVYLEKNIYTKFLGSQEFSTSINITSMSWWCIKKKKTKQESNKNLHFLSCITRILWKKKPRCIQKKLMNTFPFNQVDTDGSTSFHSVRMHVEVYSISSHFFCWWGKKMMYRRTSIIWISRLCRLFLWSQFCYKYLLVMTKIRSHIPFIKKKKIKKK